MDIMQQLSLLRAGQQSSKPFTVTKRNFEAPQYIKPNKFVVVEDCSVITFVRHGIVTTLRCTWHRLNLYVPSGKVKRDTLKRGYNQEQVLAAQKREPDSSNSFVPNVSGQTSWLLSTRPATSPPNGHLNVRLILRPTIPHPELPRF